MFFSAAARSCLLADMISSLHCFKAPAISASALSFTRVLLPPIASRRTLLPPLIRRYSFPFPIDYLLRTVYSCIVDNRQSIINKRLATRALLNGKASAFQAEYVSSILIARFDCKFLLILTTVRNRPASASAPAEFTRDLWAITTRPRKKINRS